MTDICNFKSLFYGMNGNEAIALLNKLFTMYDRTIQRYDVYEVEAIATTGHYMVSSGVPKRNGDKHATEIAKMALELMEGVRKFRLPYKSELTLEVKAGISTGSCCGGVVGLKRPKYWLFGEAVSRAARFKKDSSSMCILLGERCKALLDQKGNFSVKCNGSVVLKGKGCANVYHLIGMNIPPKLHYIIGTVKK